jgi:hypothetical protein
LCSFFFLFFFLVTIFTKCPLGFIYLIIFDVPNFRPERQRPSLRPHLLHGHSSGKCDGETLFEQFFVLSIFVLFCSICSINFCSICSHSFCSDEIYFDIFCSNTYIQIYLT